LKTDYRGLYFTTPITVVHSSRVLAVAKKIIIYKYR